MGQGLFGHFYTAEHTRYLFHFCITTQLHQGRFSAVFAGGFTDLQMLMTFAGDLGKVSDTDHR